MQDAWTMFALPAGCAARTINEPFTWDGERLALGRAPLWMEHTYEVLVDELGLDPVRFAELVSTNVLW